MSGPVRTEDVPPDDPAGPTVPSPRPPSPRPASTVEVIESREARVDGQRVLRALPRRGHRTVGAWCFADHMVPGDAPLGIGPHPHIGLQTVTWLVSGELLHHDSLGLEQLIRPGQLNLMTAGGGVAHAEEAPTGRDGTAVAGTHGVQLWVAQPEATRHGPAAFEHHARLPRAELPNAAATVLVGEFLGVTSPARRDTDHMGAELVLAPGDTVVSLRPDYEHALVVVEGSALLDGRELVPGHLAHLGPGRAELALAASAPARLMLLGGVPFEEQVLMWWNFVARAHDEVDAARRDWEAGADRFAPVTSALRRIPAPDPPWSRR